MMHHVGVVQDVECNQDLLGEQNGMPCTTGPEKKRNLWHEGGGDTPYHARYPMEDQRIHVRLAKGHPFEVIRIRTHKHY